MIRLISILVAAVFMGGGFLVLRPLLLRIIARRVERDTTAPLPADWADTVRRTVPATRQLDSRQLDRLLRASRTLLGNRTWEGCNGLILTTEMQLIIAAQACLLTLGLEGEPYPNLREILVYPRAFLPSRVCDVRKWTAGSIPAELPAELGECWEKGIIVLAWESVLEGAREPYDGQNLAFHEFAHALAFDRRLAPAAGWPDDGSEGRPMVPDPDAWRRVLEESHDRLVEKIQRHNPSVLDRYATTNLSEFFAVATEAFFERPRALNSEYPGLYQQFSAFFRFDPAEFAPLIKDNTTSSR